MKRRSCNVLSLAGMKRANRGDPWMPREKDGLCVPANPPPDGERPHRAHGYLSVTIVEARNLGKASKMGANSPYVKLQIDNAQAARSESKANAGSNALFDETKKFVLTGGEECMHIMVKNEANLGKNVRIGTAAVPISTLLKSMYPPVEDDAVRKNSPDRNKLLEECKVLDAAVWKTQYLPMQLKEALSRMIIGAASEIPSIDATFGLTHNGENCGEVTLSIQFNTDKTAKVPPPGASKAETLARPETLHLQPRDSSANFNSLRNTAKTLFGKGDKMSSLASNGSGGDSGMYFGTSLESATAMSIGGIPFPVQQCAEYLLSEGLKTEGLFRVAGSGDTIEALVAQLDAGREVNFVSPHNAATILKRFLRDMEDPVIPFFQYQAFLAGAQPGFPLADKINLYQSLIEHLPKANQDLLKYLLNLTTSISAHSDINKMTASNLAIVLGPNILRPEVEDPTTMMSDSKLVNEAMTTIITHANKIVAVPPAPARKQPPPRASTVTAPPPLPPTSKQPPPSTTNKQLPPPPVHRWSTTPMQIRSDVSAPAPPPRPDARASTSLLSQHGGGNAGRPSVPAARDSGDVANARKAFGS